MPLSRPHRRINSRAWERARQHVLKRDGYRCQLCNKSGRMEVDHIVPLHLDGGADPLDVGGLQALCRSCHIEKTRGENRRYAATGPQLAAWRELVVSMMADSRV